MREGKVSAKSRFHRRCLILLAKGNTKMLTPARTRRVSVRAPRPQVAAR